MVNCAVLGCTSNSITIDSNSTNKIKYFRFPKQNYLLKIWIQKCHRNDQFNCATSFVCSKHFLPQDYERKLSASHQFTTLKKDAIPSINLPFTSVVSNIKFKSKKLKRSKNKQIQSVVQELFGENSRDTDSSHNSEIIANDLESENEFYVKEGNTKKLKHNKIDEFENEEFDEPCKTQYSGTIQKQERNSVILEPMQNGANEKWKRIEDQLEEMFREDNTKILKQDSTDFKNDSINPVKNNGISNNQRYTPLDKRKTISKFSELFNEKDYKKIVKIEKKLEKIFKEKQDGKNSKLVADSSRKSAYCPVEPTAAPKEKTNSPSKWTEINFVEVGNKNKSKKLYSVQNEFEEVYVGEKLDKLTDTSDLNVVCPKKIALMTKKIKELEEKNHQLEIENDVIENMLQKKEAKDIFLQFKQKKRRNR